MKQILALPFMYSFFQRINGAGKMRCTLARDMIRPRKGLRVLDLGCGTADIVKYCPDTEYVGVDASPSYVRYAQKKYKDRPHTKFVCSDLNEYLATADGTFDIILLFGIMHHISDEEVVQCLDRLSSLLADDGRVITLDGAFHPSLCPFERFLLNQDRGDYVRTVDEWLLLVPPHLPGHQHVLRKDLYYLPYHIILFY